ncbi:AMP-binding protein [Actinomyces sp. B33]|uniref:AMP-binding protein n=1 Tax=Actinomyces sp. B33 TaxID=2942131 RepID=UPI0023403A31|nr:AMP-binding protein [Actinomyces sp. B33]MDC4233383.1 AMP-binding protein [Actinomyces sp. B33]
MTSHIVEQAHEHYNYTPWEVPVWDRSLFALLDDAARLYPSRVAIDYFGATTTYAQVHDQVLRAARVLVDAGVRRGDAVAIALPNCPQAFVAFYACMRIGAVAAQHNPLAPASQIRGQLERHRARVAVVWEKSAADYPLDGSTPLERVFTVDVSLHMPVAQRVLLRMPVERARRTRDQLRGPVPEGASSWDRAVSSARRIREDHPHASAGDRAVVLHTSGTNGVPKSAVLTHRNIGTNVDQCMFWVWMLHEGAETFYSLLPYFHAFGLTFFLCAAVRKAATQVLLPKFDAAMALEAHRRTPVTFFVGVPPMFERILNEATRTGTDISSIRYAVAGAMPLSTDLASRWEEATGGMIVEGYGLSETSPVLMGAPLSEKRRHGVLGLPFPSTDVRLVDLEDPTKDVEDGQPGEILVKGPQVFEGYLDAPEETAEMFTDDGWLRTGDIGVNSDGFISMADRRKELILSGGFNVYPSQVEDAIRSMPEVKDVAVVGVPRPDESEQVTAAIILEDDAPMITLEQVRTWAEKSIAHYALPRQIVFIAEMPRNQIGKILRRKVREEIVGPAADALGTAARQVGGYVQSASDTVSRLLARSDEESEKD